MNQEVGQLGSRNRRWIAAVVGAMGLVVVIVGGLVLLRPFGSAAVPSGSPVASQPVASQNALAPSPTATLSPYYADGIPRTWQGAPVLRGQAALDAAKASTDATPFYIAYWVGQQWDRSCPLMQTDSDLLFGCGGMVNIGDQPGLVTPVSATIGNRLRGGVPSVPGPVIVRVHTHDKLADGCPVDWKCELDMVAEEIVWSGGPTTAPAPITVTEAASAFDTAGVSYSNGINICPVSSLPGIPVLPWWPGGVAAAFPVGVVAVFPSEQALDAAAPQEAAADGVGPPTRYVNACQGPGPDQGMVWFSRENILVGVLYDQALGPDKDPAVVKARADLAKLGE